MNLRPAFKDTLRSSTGGTPFPHEPLRHNEEQTLENVQSPTLAPNATHGRMMQIPSFGACLSALSRQNIARESILCHLGIFTREIQPRGRPDNIISDVADESVFRQMVIKRLGEMHLGSTSERELVYTRRLVAQVLWLAEAAFGASVLKRLLAISV